MSGSYTPQTQVGRGTTIGWTPTGGSATAFLSMVNVTPPGASVGETENVLMSSTFKPFVPTIPEGEGSFKVQHWDNDPGCVAMQTACAVAPVPMGVFLITLPSGATLSFPGFPKGYKVDEISNEEIITAEVDYRRTGVGTYTPAGGGTSSSF